MAFRLHGLLFLAVLATASPGLVLGAATPPDESAASSPVRPRRAPMDYGSLLTYTVGLPSAPGHSNDNLALKGVCLRVGDGGAGAVCFDTDLLRYYAGWTGGFLDLSRTHLTSYKGDWHALIEGNLLFSTRREPGGTQAESFASLPAPSPGPLPHDAGRYLGLYRHADQVVLHYLIGDAEVWETPDWVSTNGVVIFLRHLQIGAGNRPLRLKLFDAADTAPRTDARRQSDLLSIPGAPESPPAMRAIDALSFRAGDRSLGVALLSEAVPASRDGSRPPRVGAIVDSTRTLDLVLDARPCSCTAILWSAPPEADLRQAVFIPAASRRVQPRDLCRPGAPRWPQTLVTRGRLGVGAGPYVVDSVNVPEQNPWNSWMRCAAFDFFSDGRAAVSTWNGDVWIVSGLDAQLQRVTWKRFAAGLFEPLGLKIVHDEVFVLCRDQLMRLVDANGDGEADEYQCFNNDTWVAPSYHAFALDLQTDRAGNFYYTRCGQRVDPALPLNGGMVKVSKDGAHAELIATGLRAANGMAIGPGDEIVCGDNQGNWIPSSKINWIRPGGFYGYLPHARREPPPTDYEKPICWLPMIADNSSGGQAWITSDRWGPFSGQLLHTSYGRAALFLVLTEEVDGVHQGGVVRFPLRFDSGIMRARFHPGDQQLWVCGLKGWETSGPRDGAFQRVRYTGAPVRWPSALHVASNGLHLTFTTPLERASATDPDNYAVEQWNYLWSEKYGSPEFSVAHPEKIGHDPVAVQSVSLSADGRTIFLHIPSLQPVMQMRIRFRLRSADGAPVEHEIFNTINRVPK